MFSFLIELNEMQQLKKLEQFNQVYQTEGDTRQIKTGKN
jgi:hypothetical protein